MPSQNFQNWLLSPFSGHFIVHGGFSLVGLMGAKWGRWVKNPTILFVGTSTLQKNHSPKNTQPQDEPLLHRPAALPSLSMSTSTMDRNCGAAAPCESNVGGQPQGLRLLRLILLLGAPKWHPWKNWERWAEHWAWVATTQQWYTTTNLTMA